MSVITIVQGEDRSLNFQIKEVDSSDVTTYMDLTGATEIELRAPDNSTGYISFKLSNAEVAVIDSKNGIFKVLMSDTKTALLRIGQSQNIEVIVDIGSERRIAQLLKAITVVSRLFP